MQANDISNKLGTHLQVKSRVSGAKYCGILGALRNKAGKFCLTKLVPLNQDGSFKLASKADTVRWFSLAKFEVCYDPVKL